MAKKSIGYVKLEWTCPRCGSKNPGPQKTCSACGGPQPEDVVFSQAQGQELIQGEDAEKIAQQKPDIHCGFCGTRNPADVATCSQCGADLKEGKRRESGSVVGAYTKEKAPDVNCPNCGQPNPADFYYCRNCGGSLAKPVVEPTPTAASVPAKRKISPLMIVGGIIIIIALIFGCLAVTGMLGKSEQVVGTVQDVAWTTSVVIESFQQVEREDWFDEIPSGADVGACEYRYSYTDDEPQPVSTEVCGTPYTVDQGTGFGEVVQDCTYEVYAEYCTYTVSDWVEVDQAVLTGSDLFPQLAQPQLTSDQRLGETDQEFSIVFMTDQGSYTYTTTDLGLFQQAQVGSRWNLTIRGSGRVSAIEPAN